MVHSQLFAMLKQYQNVIIMFNIFSLSISLSRSLSSTERKLKISQRMQNTICMWFSKWFSVCKYIAWLESMKWTTIQHAEHYNVPVFWKERLLMRWEAQTISVHHWILIDSTNEQLRHKSLFSSSLFGWVCLCAGSCYASHSNIITSNLIWLIIE